MNHLAGVSVGDLVGSTVVKDGMQAGGGVGIRRDIHASGGDGCDHSLL